ncbi:MAG: glycosyltransferase family 4 protein [Euryarchaeota archaeon]|jgi:glycosyltransferase involved in cell wall biosynthesis|nr:glycosyltransferase family 4 protein [Euryarchaeota archaeon]MBT6644696.1 glycosyltransferase family 4 protein [Euryarchaeota archaeon]
MQIYWFTNRSFNDLCSTTQLSLANGIISHGHDLTIIGPGPEKNDVKWNHVVVERSSIRGLQAKTLGKNMAKYVKNIPTNEGQKVVVLVHWSLVKYLCTKLNNREIIWQIMDRSPPADSGILAKLQKKVWEKAWDLTGVGHCKGGFVVSQNHKKLVEKHCGREMNNISILPAGVDLTLFNSSTRTDTQSISNISFVYHGRIDKNRGIIEMVNILQKLSALGHKSKLTLIGKGNAVGMMKKLALKTQGNYEIEIFDAMPQEKLAQKISQSNFGLLPMPYQRVWAVASPLKRSEYLASGLLVFGIDHTGHQLEGAENDFFGLFSQQELATKGTDWVINAATSASLGQAKVRARMYAEEHCSWDCSITILMAHLERAVE